jgi:hypothetical protein
VGTIDSCESKICNKYEELLAREKAIVLIESIQNLQQMTRRVGQRRELQA